MNRPGKTNAPGDSDGADAPSTPTPPDGARLHARAKEPGAKTVNRKVFLFGTIAIGSLVMAAAYFGLKPPPEEGPFAPDESDNRRSAYSSAMPDQLTQRPVEYDDTLFETPDIEAPPEAETPSETVAAVDMTPQYRTAPPPQIQPAPAPPAPPSPEEQARLDEIEASRTSPLFFDGRAETFATADSAAASSAEQAALQNASAQAQGSGAAPGAQIAPSRDTSFMSDAQRALYLDQPLVAPISRFEVKSGTMVPLILTTAINSDLPGRITARVSSNIYDSATGQHLLIPYGSTVEGEYDDAIKYGASRILIRWDELTLPNGDSILLEGMPATDPQGRAGLDADVNRHFFRLAAAVGISGAFSVLGQLATDDSEEGSLSDNVGDAVAQEAARVGGRVVDRELQVEPTLTADLGSTLHLQLNRDILIRPYRESQ